MEHKTIAAEAPVQTVAQRELAKSTAALFGGDPHAPFDDGATPEVLAGIKRRKELFEAERASQKLRLTKKSERIMSDPLRSIAFELARVFFEHPLDGAENARALGLMRGIPPGERCDVQLMLRRYWRVQFTINNTLFIACTRNVTDYASVLRIADMLRVLLWPYRRDGKSGIKVEDGRFNLSYGRAVADLRHETKIAVLLETFRDELLKLTDELGNPRLTTESTASHTALVAAKRVRVQRGATLMRRTDELAAQVAAAEGSVKDLRAAVGNLTGIILRTMARLEALEKKPVV